MIFFWRKPRPCLLYPIHLFCLHWTWTRTQPYRLPHRHHPQVNNNSSPYQARPPRRGLAFWLQLPHSVVCQCLVVDLEMDQLALRTPAESARHLCRKLARVCPSPMGLETVNRYKNLVSNLAASLGAMGGRHKIRNQEMLYSIKAKKSLNHLSLFCTEYLQRLRVYFSNDYDPYQLKPSTQEREEPPLNPPCFPLLRPLHFESPPPQCHPS